MKPSNFRSHPWDSVTKNNESETVAANIMKILARTGDTWRSLSWSEYKAQRLQDGNFSESEKTFFDKASSFCESEELALEFCPHWGE
jgi:hypothetical protein